jgi:CBS domain-containing protein
VKVEEPILLMNAADVALESVHLSATSSRRPGSVYILAPKRFQNREALTQQRRDEESVKQIMSKTVRTIKKSKSVRGAIDTMIKHNIGSVVVVDDSKVVGIITERDVMRNIRRGTNYLDRKCGDVCSKPVISIGPNAESWEAFEIMLRNKIRRLPVLDENQRLAGIVTERDLFKWVLRVIYEPNVPKEIMNLISQSD